MPSGLSLPHPISAFASTSTSLYNLPDGVDSKYECYNPYFIGQSGLKSRSCKSLCHPSLLQRNVGVARWTSYPGLQCVSNDATSQTPSKKKSLKKIISNFISSFRKDNSQNRSPSKREKHTKPSPAVLLIQAMQSEYEKKARQKLQSPPNSNRSELLKDEAVHHSRPCCIDATAYMIKRTPLQSPPGTESPNVQPENDLDPPSPARAQEEIENFFEGLRSREKRTSRCFSETSV